KREPDLASAVRNGRRLVAPATSSSIVAAVGWGLTGSARVGVELGIGDLRLGRASLPGRRARSEGGAGRRAAPPSRPGPRAGGGSGPGHRAGPPGGGRPGGRRPVSPAVRPSAGSGGRPAGRRPPGWRATRRPRRRPPRPPAGRRPGHGRRP